MDAYDGDVRDGTEIQKILMSLHAAAQRYIENRIWSVLILYTIHQNKAANKHFFKRGKGAQKLDPKHKEAILAISKFANDCYGEHFKKTMYSALRKAATNYNLQDNVGEERSYVESYIDNVNILKLFMDLSLIHI